MLDGELTTTTVWCIVAFLAIAVVAIDYCTIQAVDLIWRTIMRLWRRPRLPRKP